MGKLTQKLLIYLDQNWISNISKAESNTNVAPDTRDIFETLHNGFLNEKLVVPRSILHDIESSHATHLKDEIITFQHYMGQVNLCHPDQIKDRQMFAAFDYFTGSTSENPLRVEDAFWNHPDRPVNRFGVYVDAHLERCNLRENRDTKAKKLEAARKQLVMAGTRYDQQLKVERRHYREMFASRFRAFCGDEAFSENRQKIIDFTESTTFLSIPLLEIQAHLCARIFTNKDRPIGRGDDNDIAVLSAYTPYMDVVCTDAFMADKMRSFAKKYAVKFFTARTESMREFKEFLKTL